jgi:hypothetical protein
MPRGEAEQFLTSVKELSPDLYPLFLMALRAGLRKGELIACRVSEFTRYTACQLFPHQAYQGRLHLLA